MNFNQNVAANQGANSNVLVTYRFELWKKVIRYLELITKYLWLMLCISRKENFNAAHKLYNENWSKERNVEIFGPCANENWHGHNFELIVTVKGHLNPETGLVVNLK